MWKPPTLDALSKSVRDTFKSEVPGTDPWVWPNTMYIITKVFAGLMRSLYQRLDYIHKQRFTSTASDEYLDEHGADEGLSRAAATFAAGQATVTIDPLQDLAAQTRLVRGDGTIFVIDHLHHPTQNFTTVNIRADLPGMNGNTLDGTTLTLETPISGVGDFTVTANGLVGGSDQETDASYRARILEKKRNPPHGGSPSEYIAWSREVVGVTRVYVQRAKPAPGSVTVIFMMDDSTFNSGIPSPAAVSNVKKHLQAVAPANANIVVKAPTALPVNVGLLTLDPDSSRIREAVNTELAAMFRRKAQPGDSDGPFIFYKSWIDEAISMAAGEGSHSIYTPATDVSCGDNIIATLGTVTYP